MAVTITEPITVDEAREAMRNNAASTVSVENYISSAREAAENYTGIDIAYREDPEDASYTVSGYTTASLPPTIRTALYFHIVHEFEIVDPKEWLGAFRDLLYDWREHI